MENSSGNSEIQNLRSQIAALQQLLDVYEKTVLEQADKLYREITERKKLQDELARLATTDALTGIFNRHKMDELLGMEINKAKRYKSPLSLIMLDIDHFKMVNDT